MPISDFPNQQPDEIEHKGRTLRLIKAQECSAGWAAAVIIDPSIIEEKEYPDVALGGGGSKPEAISDAFNRAKDAVEGN